MTGFLRSRMWVVGVVTGLLGLLAISGAPAASAHPLGNFTVNHHIGLAISADAIDVTRILDMAEIPAFQTLRDIDVDDDGVADETELRAWADATCRIYLDGLEISVNGERAPLDRSDDRRDIALQPGEGGLETLRLTCRGTVAVMAVHPLAIDVVDTTGDDRLGWREIVATGDGSVRVAGDALTTSPTAALTDYTTGAVDPAMRSAHVETSPAASGAPGTVAAATVPGAAADAPSPAPLSSGGVVGVIGNVITSGSLGLSALGVGIAGAFALGLVHAMAPGHGKTLMAAYLVGRSGTRRQAAVLGVSVAVSHTVGVAALGLITVAASSAFEPERVYPYLTAASAAIVLAIGVGLVVRTLLARRHAVQHSRSAFHGHGTDHDPGGQGHGHPHGHTHGDRWWQHRHLDTDAEGAGRTVPGWRGLAALGLSGGLVPSASAVVVFLAALNLGRIELGLVLVAAFGIGMATALIGVGLFVVAASRRGASLLQRRSRFAPLVAVFPLLGAVAVLIIGLALTVSSVGALGG